MELWVELKRMYEPDPEDQLWTLTQNFMHAPIEWKLYDLSGVHHLTAKDKEIFMLVEKHYPLRRGLALVMISYKLQVKSSHWQYKFPLPVKVVATARRFEMPLREVCTAIEEKKKKVPKQVEDFIPMGSKEEAGRLKRKGLNLEKEQNYMHAPVEWKLYDLSGVHHVTAKDKEIFMLVEKDYPLRRGLSLVMISYRLQVENHSQMAKDLIRKTYNIANTLRKQKESSYWQYMFPLLVKVVPTARRLEMPLLGVCTAIEGMIKKLSVKDRWQLH
nr:hypothetical protein [Tanacetum cinerariifolium]